MNLYPPVRSQKVMIAEAMAVMPHQSLFMKHILRRGRVGTRQVGCFDQQRACLSASCARRKWVRGNVPSCKLLCWYWKFRIRVVSTTLDIHTHAPTPMAEATQTPRVATLLAGFNLSNQQPAVRSFFLPEPWVSEHGVSTIYHPQLRKMSFQTRDRA